MVLLGLANGTPVIAKKILGTILARPLDGGMNLADGQPLFGDSKTIRGVVLSIIVTTLGAPLIGVDSVSYTHLDVYKRQVLIPCNADF